MNSHALRNTWIICKHECFKRIRTRSFLVTTFLMPLFLAAVIGIPAFLGARATHENQKIVLVCPQQNLAESIRERLDVNTKGAYHVTIDPDASDAEHQR
jgi:ABC-type Na+ efflux pump permease subunit